MTFAERRKCQKRFHELAVKEALDTASVEELRKLERYQRLLREPEHPEVRQRQEHMWYTTRILIKKSKRLARR